MRIKPIVVLAVAFLMVLSSLLLACGGAPTTPTTPATPTEPTTPTAPAEPTTPTGGPPAITHPLEGRDNCLVCHETGIAGAPAIPVDHTGRANDTCQTCHQPAA